MSSSELTGELDAGGEDELPSMEEAEATVEFAGVLFLDLVRYSEELAIEQMALITRLQAIVRETQEYRRAKRGNNLVTAPAGDGFALAFLGGDLAAPLRCSIQIAKAINERSRNVKVRMGIHAGAVFRYRDANDVQNLAGPGINIAARVMGFGDERHILVSEETAKLLREDTKWRPNLHPVGVGNAKHDRKIPICNFYFSDVGNPAVPAKLAQAGQPAAADPPASAPPARTPAPVVVAPAPAARATPRPPAPQAVADAFANADARDERPPAVSRVLSVTYSRGPKGEETLLYAPQETRTDDGVAPPVPKEINRKVLSNQLAAFQRVLSDLTDLAKRGAGRGELGIEAAAASIAKHVCPEQGLARLVGFGVHPRLSLQQDVVGQIPWEALEEAYYRCEGCQREVLPDGPAPRGAIYCQYCRPGEMRPFLGKLAVELHLSHHVPGRQPPTARGNRFVILEDPDGDLSDGAGGICDEHGRELERLLQDMGYEVKRYRGASATVEKLEAALTDPSVVGLYFFGHGAVEDREGYLKLADGGTFPASRLRDLQATTPFIFLNACEGAGAGEGWNVDAQPRSVAAELAAPVHWRTVIAPVSPVVNSQAAATALAFFRAAAEMSLGEAMQVARRESLERYRAGAPDLSWFLYRYFGNPRRFLPIAELKINRPEGKRPLAVQAFDRIFNASDELDPDVFGFGIENVLLHAARRRGAQRRARISVIDLAVGLVARGDLTRHVLSRGEVRDLDAHVALLEAPLPGEEEPGAGGEPADPDTGGVLERKQLDPELVRLFAVADRDAQGRPGSDRRVSERDVLVHLTADPRWAQVVGRANLQDFEASDFQAALEAVILERMVDENGQIQLGRLSPEARNILETAHTLAQQRGARSIQNRLMLAAFLKDPKGDAARRCRARAEADAGCAAPEDVFEKMLAMSEGQSDVASPRTFGLSPELCARIVEPMLAEARVASPWEPVSEASLFDAFCKCALPDFKAWLTGLVGLDLDAIAADRPEPEVVEGPAWMASLDVSARRVVVTAHRMSQTVGSTPIRNATLLAAFFQDEVSFAVQLLPPGLRFQDIRDWALRASTIPGRKPNKFALDDEVCARAVTPVVERAREMVTDSATPINEIVLFFAFCQVAPGELKTQLSKSRFGLDLEGLLATFLQRMAEAQEEQSQGHPQAAAPSTSEPPPAPPAATVPASDEAPSLPDIRIDLPAGLGQDRFDDDAWRCIAGAALFAKQDRWPEIRSPHLFAGMVHQRVPIPGLGPIPPDQRQELIALLLTSVPPRREPAPRGPLVVSANTRAALERAVGRAAAAGRTRANLEDLLLAFFDGEDRGGVIGTFLRELRARAQGAAVSSLAGIGPRGEAGGAVGTASVLATLGRDLTERARKGEISEIVGRQAEIDTALRSLLMRENANPLLVGDAGVGKTAIVEGVARLLVGDACPPKLAGWRIIEIEAGALVANTRFRGDLEQRVQALLSEARGNVILFIDEIHALFGAGAGGGDGAGPGAGDLFKAALARGELRLIGATTLAEHRQTVARDKALARRFQLQTIGPPSRDDTLRILSARQKDLERYHGVLISEEAKAAAVDLSGRYVLDRQWPAKARDVLEQACVLVESQGLTMAGGTAPVTADHVATVVSRATGIPLERLSTNDLRALETLVTRLDRRIVGQGEATALVVDAIRAGRQGLTATHKPVGVFLFVGPPGVGKTELAKVLAEEVYGGAEGLIRFDMGAFSEAHSVAKLIGSPPGYTGYREGAALVEALRRRPYSVVLLDEIEHAHEDVMAVFLRLFAEGTIADQDGNVADARNAIIILTSNVVGAEPERGGVGFGARSAAGQAPAEAALRAAAEKHLSKKLVDRLDAIVRFRPLGPADLELIADEKVAALVESARTSHSLRVNVKPEVLPWLAERAIESDSGAARALARVVQDHVGKALGTWLTRARPAAGAHVIIGLAGGGIDVAPG
jgi:ATP-dependent Clp protease ATP-binding subunit ClpC